MPKIITLNEIGRANKIYINANCIESFYEVNGEDYNCTSIKLINTQICFEVKEKPYQILASIEYEID